MPVLSLHEAPAVLWGDGLIRFAHSTYGIVELSKEVKRHGVHDVVHAALAVWRPLFAPAEKVEGALKVLGRPLGYWQNEPYIMPRDYHQIGPSARCPGKRGSVGHAESAQSSREEVEGYSNVVALSDAATCRINCEQAFPPSITAPTFATAAAPAVATTGTTSHAHLNGRGPCIDLEQFVPHRALVIRWTLVFVVDAQTIRHDQLHNGAQRLKWIHHMSHERCRGIKLVLPSTWLATHISHARPRVWRPLARGRLPGFRPVSVCLPPYENDYEAIVRQSGPTVRIPRGVAPSGEPRRRRLGDFGAPSLHAPRLRSEPCWQMYR
mmetsp:Transcript_33196/g.87700  ORF Transcript_33196/g.87700 Transcript_33196/m.87700 type:complete len:323 (-) Transcript_33196:327-1295(-)